MVLCEVKKKVGLARLSLEFLVGLKRLWGVRRDAVKDTTRAPLLR